MQSSPPSPKVIRFGIFEADLVTGELRKRGRKVELQDQPFHVLTLLLQRPGELVTREELRQALWPADTFVDFDESVNKAVQRLRQALGDSADNPHFVETLPRKGYRFIAPVERDKDEDENGDQRKTPLRLLAVAATLLAGLALTILSTRDHTQAPPVVLPLTTYPGYESSLSFSPDGNQVAFAWNGPKQDNWDIYIKLIGTENDLRLTRDSARDALPAWSPDGRWIAFLRDLSGKIGVFLIPVIGGPERKLAEIRFAEDWFPPLWTADGKGLAFTDRDSANDSDETSSVYCVSIDTGERRRLTSAPPGAVDGTGAFSRDGRNLVFSRELTDEVGELYLVALSGDLSPKGEPRRLTFQHRFAILPTWTPDGREIVYVSRSGSTRREMWRISVSGSPRPRKLEFAGDQVGYLAISQQGNRLVYQRILGDLNIWRLDLRGAGGKAGRPVGLISGTWEEVAPQYSPDANRIAFISSRSGYQEVWVCGSDGSKPVQLTSMRAAVTGSPRWSPDGKQIVFDSTAEGNFDVYLIDAGGGRPRRLTNHPTGDGSASFSRDGHWIYFSSVRTGRCEIWKMPAEGGVPVQVTRTGGHSGVESPDGKYLYYERLPYVSSFWKLPLDGGEEQKILEPVIGPSLTVVSRGIYYARPPQPGGGNNIEFLSFSTGKTTAIATTARPIAWSLSVSPDERYLLYTQWDQVGSDLMLVEDFQ